MKLKHIQIRIEQCLALAKASNCPRRKFGALLLDHHKTNREDVAGWERAVWDMERSGAGLAWDETQRLLGLEPEARPGFVDYVEDRDLWRFKLPGSREVNAAICSRPRDGES